MWHESNWGENVRHSSQWQLAGEGAVSLSGELREREPERIASLDRVVRLLQLPERDDFDMRKRFMVRAGWTGSLRLELGLGGTIVLLGLTGCSLGDDYVISSSSELAGDAGSDGSGGGTGAGGGAWGIGGCGPDPEPPGGLPCPPQCTVCDGSTCIIQCDQHKECEDGVVCPPDFDCVVECTGERACREATIVCPSDYDCKIQCTDDESQSCNRATFQCSEQGRCDLACGGQKQACEDALLNCGLGGCTATCSGNNRPELNCVAGTACCPDPSACPP